MFNRSFLSLVIVSTLLFSGCFIRGRVVDVNGIGISGVTVTLKGAATMTTTTDSDGYYRFGDRDTTISSGSYTVAPSKPGYNFTPAGKNITIAPQAAGVLGDVPLGISGVDFAISAPSYETTAAFHELLNLILQTDSLFLEGKRAVPDETSVIEGYRWLTEVLSVALDCYMWGDMERPAMVPIVGPTRKFMGDNADAYYYYAPIDPNRSYRIQGVRGDAAYLSLTVYGGPQDGRWSNRIVCTLNDRNMVFNEDDTFEVILSPNEQPGNWMKLEPDAECVITRDYLLDPVNGRETSWQIEAVDPAPPPRLSDADMARRLRYTANFLRDSFAVSPMALDDSHPMIDEVNAISEPYPVPQVTVGWAAHDASYAMGSFDLEEDQALIIEGTSPECVFWNMCLWNPYLQTYDYRYEQVTINGGQVQYEDDGSWRIVISSRDPGMPNWVSTADHRQGLIWFRWFLPESMPIRPESRIVALSDL